MQSIILQIAIIIGYLIAPHPNYRVTELTTQCAQVQLFPDTWVKAIAYDPQVQEDWFSDDSLDNTIVFEPHENYTTVISLSEIPDSDCTTIPITNNR